MLKVTKKQSLFTTSIIDRQLLVKSSSNNLSNENINTGGSFVFKTKRELKCQNELLFECNFPGNTSFYAFITEII